MRVIAGRLGGRTFDSPKGHRTHPMSDKVRGALFSMLGELDGLTVLDAFSGSGALSIEAVSRGAEAVVATEQDRLAQQTIARNVSALQLEGSIKLVKASVQAWSRTQPDAHFNVILCDPPYDELQLTAIRAIANAHLEIEGILVLSWPGGQETPTFDGLVRLAQKSYGDAQLVFYQKIL